jgi:hypothetical protein
MFVTKRQLRDELKLVHKRLDEATEALNALHTNGVASSIKELRQEVFKDRKVETKYQMYGNMFGMTIDAFAEPTLAGKVSAILDHLNLNVEVKPREVKESKTVAKKVTTKKKGRK